MYAWCIQNADKPEYDVMQGICTWDELPPEVRAAADARCGHWPAYVEWPL